MAKRAGYHHLCRDLKPENVLLTTNGDVKLSDFGLGHLPSSSLHNDVLQTTCGTPNYVAPEVLMRQGYYGAPADVWSLGQHAVHAVCKYATLSESLLHGCGCAGHTAVCRLPNMCAMTIRGSAQRREAPCAAYICYHFSHPPTMCPIHPRVSDVRYAAHYPSTLIMLMFCRSAAVCHHGWYTSL